MSRGDVAVVGTGPNGLAAAVTMGRAGLTVDMYEAADTVGGGLRTQPLFDSEIGHDLCSAVHPLAAASRFFREFDLASRGVELLQPEIPYAHPFEDGRAALAFRDLDATCERLGADGPRWHRLMAPLMARSSHVVDLLLSGQRGVPPDMRAALLLLVRALAHGNRLTATARFTTDEGRALLTGVAAHAVGRLPSLGAAAVAMLLGHLAHVTGWGVPRGGSARIADAMAAEIAVNGGRIHTGVEIRSLTELRGHRVVLLDVSPRGFLSIAAESLPRSYARQLACFRYGPGAAKADFLLCEPVPWINPETARAGTVHLGGDQARLFRQETLTARGVPSDEPFVLVVDPASVDTSRIRGGKRPLWAYAHVPNGDTRDPVDLIRRSIERYAPGFGDTIVAAHGMPAAEYERYNPNYVGGDIGSGAMTLYQSLARPVPRFDPYRTPLPGVYMCSSSTPPGPGVHGMCGYLAARSVLRREYGYDGTPDLAPGTALSAW
ncbi:phytoene desaturase family protein [Streptomyces fuscichromogenes]|uniref:Pyridine nucleotide-disulfide oxidoreductase domain-containing protein 2 n=1 Tax=Streptomyces fuscichromogenes TaxID=1324013 RepID=A0A917XFM4_9ACTN|nr:NAD(P)/FAD-dependent oxidoreductase [Streptomyces fuscichromogenes]GGN19694.1 phytoene dehydrogenase [Streptomyces fuscichromogenes]